MNLKKIVGIIGSGMIGTDPYEENAWSGSSRYFFSECNRQGILHRAFGVEVDGLEKAHLILRNFSLDKKLWRQKFYLDIKYYHLLSKSIVKCLTQEDLNCTLFQIGAIYNLRALLPSTSRVFSYHDGNLAQAIKSPNFPKKISDIKIREALEYERHVYEQVDKIFTMSEYLKYSFINDFGIEEKKIKVIGAGINLDVIPEIADKDYRKKNIVFIGADFYRKGGMNLLHAFKFVRDVYPQARLHIIGPHNLSIPSEYAQGVVCFGFLSKNKLTDKIKFEQVMNDSTIFVLPSTYEPFGIAPLEAMAYEIPCILTNAWAFPEMVRAGINGELVECGDVSDLAEKIIFLFKNPDRLQEMGKAGKKLVLKNFTWNTVIKKLIKEL